MKTPHTDFRVETRLSAQEAAALFDIIDEFREWIWCKYGEEIQKFHRQDRTPVPQNLMFNDDDPL